MNQAQTLDFINTAAAKRVFEKLYKKEEAEANLARYAHVTKRFAEAFGDRDGLLLFTSAGRTEISGNHTDHNHGKVLAGSINLDCVGAAARNDSRTVHIISETFSQDFTIDLDKLAPSDKKSGTIELTKGLIAGFLDKGYQAGGFDAYITSNVIAAAGVSSSASYEMLICSILNELFNDGRMDVVSYAHIGKYAENVYWDKASGLLDQMACAVGGLITIDFKNPAEPKVEKIDYDFAQSGYTEVIVQTGKGHADLSADYSSVPNEMKRVAQFFGKEVLAEVDENSLIQQLSAVREACGDRAVMRALHFFEENKRVDAQVASLKADDFQGFLRNITASGNSSWKYLQNTYTVQTAEEEQGICVALALTELFLNQIQDGACRVHGGGFAGVIMAMIPNDQVDAYISYIEKAMGEGSAYKMFIRPYGAVCINRITG